MELILLLVLVFLARKLFVSLVSSANEDAPKMVSNTLKGAANATDALPTMGAQFSAQVVSDSLSEVDILKAKLHCTDDTIRTMSQLNKWMKDNNMF